MAQVNWEFSETEINNVRRIVNEQENNPFVQKRRDQNVVEAEVSITADQFWNAHLAALLPLSSGRDQKAMFRSF